MTCTDYHWSRTRWSSVDRGWWNTKIDFQLTYDSMVVMMLPVNGMSRDSKLCLCLKLKLWFTLFFYCYYIFLHFRYTAEEFALFRKRDLFELALEYVRSSKWECFDTLMQYHSDQLKSHWLVTYSNFRSVHFLEHAKFFCFFFEISWFTAQSVS